VAAETGLEQIMNTSNQHQLTQQSTTEPTVDLRLERAQRLARDASEPVGKHLRWRPIRAAEQEARHVYDLERAGESEWTPWIAIAALILFYAALALLMFGFIEAGSRLLASASS
jgi:hypothetical protein